MRLAALLPIVLLCGCSSIPSWVAPLGIGAVAGGVATVAVSELTKPLNASGSGAALPQVVVADTTCPEAANLVATMHKVATDIHSDGTPPQTDATAFLRDASAALTEVAGQGKILPSVPATAAAEAAKIRAALAERQRQNEATQALLQRLLAQRQRKTWVIAGVVSAVALVGVAVVFATCGRYLGLLALGVWAILTGALGTGVLYRHDAAVFWASGVIVLVVAAIVCALVVFLSRKLSWWKAFGEKELVVIQEMRRMLDDKTRAQVDSMLRRAQAHDREHEAAVATIKANLNLAHVEGKPCG